MSQFKSTCFPLSVKTGAANFNCRHEMPTDLLELSCLPELAFQQRTPVGEAGLGIAWIYVAENLGDQGLCGNKLGLNFV